MWTNPFDWVLEIFCFPVILLWFFCMFVQVRFCSDFSRSSFRLWVKGIPSADSRSGYAVLILFVRGALGVTGTFLFGFSNQIWGSHSPPSGRLSGPSEVQEVAALAASCVNLRGEERPTMRQVEHALEGLRGSTKYKKDDMVAAEFENDSIVINRQSSTKEGQSFEESSRRYSLEQSMMMSARYPR